MPVLHLTLEKRWFDLIASGAKKIEYRIAKPYWQTRLQRGITPRSDFAEVHFRNGYRSYSPFMRVECHGIVWFDPSKTPAFEPKHGEILEGCQFGILLGAVLELR